jgi:hypothetical protein
MTIGEDAAWKTPLQAAHKPLNGNDFEHVADGAPRTLDLLVSSYSDQVSQITH